MWSTWPVNTVSSMVNKTHAQRINLTLSTVSHTITILCRIPIPDFESNLFTFRCDCRSTDDRNASNHQSSIEQHHNHCPLFIVAVVQSVSGAHTQHLVRNQCEHDQREWNNNFECVYSVDVNALFDRNWCLHCLDDVAECDKVIHGSFNSEQLSLSVPVFRPAPSIRQVFILN